MAIAIPIDDGVNGWDEYLEVTQTGLVGHRHYMVDSRVLSEGLTASNMPQRGDPWDATLPELEVTGIAPVMRCGVIALTERGWGVWKVSYATREAQVLDPTGQPWTELDLGTVQVTVYQGVDTLGNPTGPSIQGGAPREAGRIGATVYTYRPKSSAVPLASWLPFVGFTNSVATTLPRIQRTAFGQAFAIDQVLYMGVQGIRDVGSRLELAHRVQLAPDFLHRESRTRDNGEVVEVRTSRIYGRKDFRSVLV